MSHPNCRQRVAGMSKMNSQRKQVNYNTISGGEKLNNRCKGIGNHHEASCKKTLFWGCAIVGYLNGSKREGVERKEIFV